MGRCEAGDFCLRNLKDQATAGFCSVLAFLGAKTLRFCDFGFFLRCLRKNKSVLIKGSKLSSITKPLCSGQSDHAFFRLAEIWTWVCTVLVWKRYGDNFFAIFKSWFLGLSVQNLFWQCRQGKCSTFWPWPPLVFLAFFALFWVGFFGTIEVWRNSGHFFEIFKIFKKWKNGHFWD